MDDVFINYIGDVHGDKYDYSLVDFINTKTKVDIVCPIHNVFKQTPEKHKSGQGCPLCSGNVKKTTEQFIIDAKKVHGDKYDYSLSDYKGNSVKVKIVCHEHGVFEQMPKNHIGKKHGCPDCKGGVRKTIEQFIIDAKKVHGDKYDYSLTKYVNACTKIKIICKEHNIFEQTPSSHINHEYGCPLCSTSKGELRISNLLQTNGIEYIPQKIFSGCRYKYPLKFDFYLPDYNTCIEFNGRQHYEAVDFFGGTGALKESKMRDNIKKEYCVKNNINFFVIKYDEDVDKKLNYIINEKFN